MLNMFGKKKEPRVKCNVVHDSLHSEMELYTIKYNLGGEMIRVFKCPKCGTTFVQGE